MYCTKCGKEIPDGETKICEECQKKILEEITNAENFDDEKKSEKEETQNKENVSKKEKKLNPFLIIIAIILILIVVIFSLGIFYTGTNVYINKIKNFFADNLNMNVKTAGNSIGNIRNYGYGAKSGNYIYYLSPNEDSSQVGIFKVKKDGTDIKQLFMNSGDEQQEIVSVNAYGNYVYFIGISSKAPSEQDQVDNKIYRMKTDGSDVEVINDNEFNNNCYEIYIINGYIYYIDVNANVARMKQDGSNKEVVVENGTGYLGITNKYIIYNTLKEGSTEEYVTNIMDIDGKNQRPIIKDKRLYSVNIEDNYIYYTNEDKKIYRTRLDSNEEELVYDSQAYNLNVSGEYAYFLNYKDEANEDYTVCIYRVTLDPSFEGKKAETIKELETYSSFLNVIDDWILYMDSSDTAGTINLVKIDGSDEKNLYTLKYEDYYNSLNTATGTTEEEPTEGEPTETAEPTNETTPTTENAVTNAVATTENVVSTNVVANQTVTNEATATTNTTSQSQNVAPVN